MLLILAAMFAIGSPSLLMAQPAGTNQPPPVQSTEPGELAAPISFEWKSGYGDYTLEGFLGQIKTNFGFDLRASADIPQQMLHVAVPSMKIKTRSVWDVLFLYNQISGNYPEIGRWAVVRMGSASPVNAVLLIPPKQPDLEDSLSVRAFTLRNIPAQEQTKLLELISLEGARLKLETEKGIKASLLRGDVHFHNETEICVATGGKAYVEMVGSLIEAFREGRHTPKGPYTTRPPDNK